MSPVEGTRASLKMRKSIRINNPKATYQSIQVLLNDALFDQVTCLLTIIPQPIGLNHKDQICCLGRAFEF